MPHPPRDRYVTQEGNRWRSGIDVATALQQVERIARSSRSVVTSDARKIVVGIVLASFSFAFNPDAIGDCDENRIRGAAQVFDVFQCCIRALLN